MIEGVKMADADYFAAEGLSKSFLAVAAECPQKAGMPITETAAMRFGKIVHCAILEPDAFDERYAVSIQCDRRTKAGKEAWQQWLDDNEGKEVISQDDYDKAMQMSEAIRSHARASELLSCGMAEMAYFWTDERTQETCKAKADYVHGDIIVDLKTTASASKADFMRSVAQYKYHWQDAWYSNGIGAERFVFVAIEKNAPYIIECYELKEVAKQLGWRQINKALDKWLMHRDFCEYIGYNGYGDIEQIDLPAWAYE